MAEKLFTPKYIVEWFKNKCFNSDVKKYTHCSDEMNLKRTPQGSN